MMRFFYIITFYLSLAISPLFAQTPILNGDLEEWEKDALIDYEEPAGYWATANPIALLGPSAPVTTFKETENIVPEEGQFAAKVITSKFDLFDGFIITGTLAIGVFKPNVTDFVSSLKLGMPFTEKPTHFSGHYMYQPQNGDSCAVYVQLFKYNTESAKRDTIAEAWVIGRETMSEYEAFNIPLNYYSDETPDSMAVVCVSSAAGHLFLAQEGSTLYVDGLKLGYLVNTLEINVPLMPEVSTHIYPNPVIDQFTLKISQPLNDAHLEIYDLQGRKCFQTAVTSTQLTIETAQFPIGHYYYQLYDQQQVVAGGKIAIGQ